MAGDEAAPRAEQEKDRLVKLTRVPAAPQRDLRGEPFGETVRVRAEFCIHLGGEKSRRHGVHPDSVAAPLRRQLTGQPDEAGLGRDVGGVGDLGDRAQAHHRGHVDDRAPAALSHVAGSQAGQRVRGDQIEVDHLGERLRRRAQRGPGRAHAGVVDQTVDAPMALHHGCYQPFTVGIRRRPARRAARTGTAPQAASARASCSPRPELAPVTTITRPAKPPARSSSSLGLFI